jgi:hypothetical protein
MKRIALAVIIVACGSDERADPSHVPAAPKVNPPSEAPPDNPAPMPAAIAKAPAVKLPAKGIDVHKVLGAARGQVAKIVGRGRNADDYGTIHEVGSEADESDIILRVEYDENGKAGLVSITTHMYPRDMSAADVDAVLKWAGATKDDEWLAGDSALEIWDAGALARSNERRRVGGLLGDYIKQVGAGSGHARGELNSSILIRSPFGTTCTRSLLTKYREEFVDNVGVDLKKLGFVSLTCGLDGAVLKLR